MRTVTMVNTLKKILNKNIEYDKYRDMLNVDYRVEVINKMANGPKMLLFQFTFLLFFCLSCL